MDYQEFKKKALETEPVSYSVSLADIEILAENLLSIKGFTIPMKLAVLKDIAKILKVPMSMMNTFDEAIGKEAKMNFINFIRTNISANKNTMVTVIASRVSKNIVAIHTGSVLPYEVYFRIFEELMNKHPFEIKDLILADEQISISAILREKQFNVGKTDGEDFYPGFSFTQGLTKGTALDSYIYRLICSNGMIGKDYNDPIRFGPKQTLNYGGIAEEFFNRIDKLSQNNLIPVSFQENVDRAMKTNASFAEVKSAARHIYSTSPKVSEFIDSFIPINEIKNKLSNKNVDINMLTTAQEKTIITNCKVWDLVNGITDYASHDYGFSVSPESKIKLQTHANMIINNKTHDNENTLGINLSE